MSNDPLVNPGPDSQQPPARQGKSPAAIILLILALFVLLLLFCGGVLVALLVPAVSSARSAARQVGVRSNLVNLGMAMQQYHEVHQQYPPVAILSDDQPSEPLASWRVSLVPYLDLVNVASNWDSWDQTQKWDSPANQSLSEDAPDIYTNYLTGDGPSNRTNIYGVRHPEGVFSGQSPVSASDITDGAERTLLAVVLPNRTVPWAAPDEIDLPQLQAALGDASIDQPVFVLYCNGRVEIFNEPLDALSVEALVTINAGD